MCGIAGVFKSNFREVDELELNRMFREISHRGPDGEGRFKVRHLALLHSRLSIIDTSTRANQPLFNEDGTIVLVCNGEIYNYKALRNDLKKLGHNFSCESDSEVLIHLYEENSTTPEKMLPLLKGMFAFALYDLKRDRLFIARDRFGIKPLYFKNDETGFYFASEINAIVETGRDSIDFSSLFEYLQYLSIPEPNTIFKNIKTIPAGKFALIDREGVRIHEWYSLLTRIKGYEKVRDPLSYSEQIFDKIKTSINEHSVSDVPIGSFLSAGIDSTIVTHFASNFNKSDFTAISAGFPDGELDESRIASSTAKQMNVKHAISHIDQDFFSDAEQTIRRFDQPFAIASAFPLFKISRLARTFAKVILTGDGGDEVFAGYDYKYLPIRRHQIVETIPSVFHKALGRTLMFSKNAKLNGLGRNFILTPAKAFAERNKQNDFQWAWKVINTNFHKEIDLNRFDNHVNQIFEQASHLEPIHQILFADISTFLKSEMLYKVDRMTMANGIEARVPFLDHEVVELAFQASSNLLRNENMGKMPLRGWVDRNYEGLGFRPKTGFNSPLNRVLTEESSIRFVNGMIDHASKSFLIDFTRAQSISSDPTAVNMKMALLCLGGWLKGR